MKLSVSSIVIVVPDTYQGVIMKRLYLFLSMFVIVGFVSAQDTIVLRDGRELQVKVVKVTDEVLEYHLWDNLNGPLREKNVADVAIVKYSDGTHEEYERSGVRDDSRMDVHRGRLLLNGKTLGDEDLARTLDLDQYYDYRSASRMRKAGVSLNTAGWIIFGVGLSSAVIGGAYIWTLSRYYVNRSYYYDSQSNGYHILLTGGIIATGLGVSLLIPGNILKGIGDDRIKDIANAYNRQNDLSLEISPSLMPTMAGSMGYGTGITLRF